ncbi:MAG: hypothetical protein HQK83_08710 [Fibrobacteria bacterium]|nr:hypothetical protein [Fibrobacteria bacterium]
MLPMYVIARLDRAIQRTKVSKMDENRHFFWWIPRSSHGMTSLNHFFILMTQPALRTQYCGRRSSQAMTIKA